jgi:hypothetical protein
VSLEEEIALVTPEGRVLAAIWDFASPDPNIISVSIVRSQSIIELNSGNHTLVGAVIIIEFTDIDASDVDPEALEEIVQSVAPEIGCSATFGDDGHTITLFLL